MRTLVRRVSLVVASSVMLITSVAKSVRFRRGSIIAPYCSIVLRFARLSRFSMRVIFGRTSTKMLSLIITKSFWSGSTPVIWRSASRTVRHEFNGRGTSCGLMYRCWVHVTSADSWMLQPWRDRPWHPAINTLWCDIRMLRNLRQLFSHKFSVLFAGTKISSVVIGLRKVRLKDFKVSWELVCGKIFVVVSSSRRCMTLVYDYAQHDV